jgi:hypothetical protein
MSAVGANTDITWTLLHSLAGIEAAIASEQCTGASQNVAIGPPPNLYAMPARRSLIGTLFAASAEFVATFTKLDTARLVYRYSIRPRTLSGVFDTGASSPIIGIAATRDERGQADMRVDLLRERAAPRRRTGHAVHEQAHGLTWRQHRNIRPPAKTGIVACVC